MCLVKCSGIYLLDCCKDSDFSVSSQNSYSLYVDGVQKDSERSVNLHGCLCCMNIPIPPDSRLDHLQYFTPSTLIMTFSFTK